MSRDWNYTGQLSAPSLRRAVEPCPTSLKQRAALVAVPVVSALVLVGTGAAAFWTANGSGTGTSNAATALPLTAVPVTSSSTPLYPGATTDLQLSVVNQNLFPVQVTAITSGGSITSSNATLCPPASTGVSFVAPTSLTPFTVPAKNAMTGVNGTAPVTLTGAVKMSNESVTGCQGLTFTIPVTLAGQSAP